MLPKLYECLRPSAVERPPFTGLLRMIAMSRDGVGMWFSPINPQTRSGYMPGPQYRKRADVEEWISSGQATPSPIDVPGQWLMSDAQIRGGELALGEAEVNVRLLKRNSDWALIADLVDQHSTADILDRRLLPAWVRQRAAGCGVSKRRLYCAVHRYWAGGCNRNALLPEYASCGAPNQQREQKRKLGRRNVEVKAGHEGLAGFVMTKQAEADLQLGWDNFHRGRSVREAYLETMAAFWRESVEIKDGVAIPVLLPAHQRPTVDQFRYWGPKGEGNQEAWRMHLGVNEWEKEHRPLPGSATDGIVAVGQSASIDATSGDVHLVSVASRIRVVGPLTRITVLDNSIRYIPGMYCGFDAPSASTALQAIAHAASDKVEYCARYGIDIKSEEWPPLAHKLYLADNGELRNEQSIEALKQWGGVIEYAESGRADRKPVESDHRSAQARVDHRLPGTTFGRQKKRGERQPALKACLNHYEYVRQHIRRILFHNNHAPVPHLLTLEMRRDGVRPYRLDILRWMEANGYGTFHRPSVEILRAHFLPEFRAVIKGNGLFIFRPDCNDKRLITSARFVGPYLLDSGLMERSRHRNIDAVVRCDPNDLSKVWLPTRQGLMELRNVQPDTLLVTQATLRDLLAIQDDDGLARHRRQSDCDQHEVEFIVARDYEAEQAMRKKKAAVAAMDKKPSAAALTHGRRENRELEKAAQKRRQRLDAQATPAPELSADEPPAVAKEPKEAEVAHAVRAAEMPVVATSEPEPSPAPPSASAAPDCGPAPVRSPTAARFIDALRRANAERSGA